MKRHALKLGRTGAAIFAAIAINAGLLLAMAALNSQASETRDQDPATVAFTDFAPPRPEPREQPEPEPTRTEREPMQARIEAPSPEAPSPAPVSLDVSISAPAPSPVRVAVTPTAAPVTNARNDGTGGKKTPEHEPGPRTARLRELPGNAKPSYPRYLRQRGIEGAVTVRLVIDAQGHVQRVEYISGHTELREQVERVIHDYRFEPAGERGPRLRQGTKRFLFEIQER